MANTRGFQVVIEAAGSLIRKSLRAAWKSAECPVCPGDEGRIPQFLQIPAPLFIGGFEVKKGEAHIPQDQLDATLAPEVNGAELKFGLEVQLQIKNPPVPSAQLIEMPVDVRAKVPIGTLPDSQDVGLLLEGLPRANVSANLTGGHPLDAKLDTLLDEFIHRVYENGGALPPIEPHIPHVVDEEGASFTMFGTSVADLDVHVELFDDEADSAHRINVNRPDANTLVISIPIYMRMHSISSSLLSLADPMAIETRLNISAPFESPPGVYRAKLSDPTVTVDSIQPAGAGVSGSTLEGLNYTANKDDLAHLPLISPNLDELISAELITRGEQLAMEIGDFEIEVPTEQEIEDAIADFFHTELKSRKFVSLWTPTAANAEFAVDALEVEVIASALIIALNPGAGADVTDITGFIPDDRDFAIALNAVTVQSQLDQAKADNGFDPPPAVRLEEDGKQVDLRRLDFSLVDGAIRMEGEVTVLDAILGSIDVDADFSVDIGLHWRPNASLNSEGFQELEHHIIGEPVVDPEETVLFWVIAIILAVISFGAGSILLAIIIIVVALIVQAVAANIGSEMAVDAASGAIEGIQAWPGALARIGRTTAVFHDNESVDPSGVVIDPTGIVLEGTLEVVSFCETTTVLAANSGGTYRISAATPLLLKAAHVHSAAKYRWLAGDGSAEVPTKNKLHTYMASGLYVAEHGLTIDEPGGAGSRHFTLVEVQNVPPVVDVGPDLTVREGELVTLVGHFYDVEPSDTHESVWIFGDHQAPQAGVIVETNNPPRAEGTSTVQHRWCDNGEYVVLLRVRDQNGGVGTDTLRVTVLNVPPVVDAGPDFYAYSCTPITLTGRFKDPGWCDTHVGSWNFGDCTPEQTAVVDEVNEAPSARGVVIASHIYERCGIYHAVCTVVDDDGGVGSDFTVIRVVDINNRGFEGGFRRLADGEVANGWNPYLSLAASPSILALPQVNGRDVFRCEHCTVHGGQRSQKIHLPISSKAGIRQSVGANPGWAYQVDVWFSIAEGGVGIARLGVDPGGGSDPASPDVAWSEAGFSAAWAQLVQRVVATDNAITIFLEAVELAQEKGNGVETQVWFDDAQLIAIQPFCLEARPEEVPRDQCVDFTDLKPDTKLPSVYDKSGFVFTAMDGQHLTAVNHGMPPMKTKLVLRSDILIELPFAAAYVRVEVGTNTRTPVYLIAINGAGQVVGENETSISDSPALATLEIEAEDIVRLKSAPKV